MSLVVKNKNARKSDKSIKCYEIVLKRYSRKRGCSNPIYSFPYGGYINESVIKGDELMEDNNGFDVEQVFPNVYAIRNGLIHSYKNYEDAFTVSCDMGTSVIYECEIPCNTPYYEGTTSDGFEGFLSKSVRFIKRV